MTIAEIKANNQLAGQYFFSRDTMKFFKSKVLPTVYGGKYFITRETDPRGNTAFTVREAIDGGKNIKTVGDFHAITTIEKAREVAKELTRTLVIEHVGHCPRIGDGCVHATYDGRFK